MTREQQIKRAATVNSNRLSEAISFVRGAQWADEHPNIENLWHNASEEPIFHSDIVVIDKHNSWCDIQSYDDEDYDYKELYGWEACVENYEIVRWAYISDLLPKGGKK